MIVVELTYKKSFDEVDELLEEHKCFLDECYASGLFIASGAKVPRDGGVIIAVGERSVIEDSIKQDPFYKNQIAEYRIMEFVPSKYSVHIKKLIQ